MHLFSRKHISQRGEVASILSMISMVVIGVGFMAGLASTQQGALSRSSRAEGIDIQDTFKGLPVGRSDGPFIATPAVCGAHFTTQIDPYIKDIIITSPPTKAWPTGQKAFSLVENGGLTDMVDLVYDKNYSITVRFNPADPNKQTPHDNDLLVTYKKPSQADKTFVVDESKVPSWIRTEDTEVILVFTYARNPVTYRFSSATSKKCEEPTITTTPTPTPTIAACYDACTTDAQCGEHEDPATGQKAKMICLKRERTPAAVQNNSSFLGFQVSSDPVELTDRWPYKSVAQVKTNIDGPAINYTDGLKWKNSDGKNEAFKDSDNRAQVVWSTISVPASLRNHEYDIALEGLPANFEIVSTFCKNMNETGRPNGCSNFAESNTANKSATIRKIKIIKDASIEYGWIVKPKIPTLTAFPATPDPINKQPIVCEQISGKVPAAARDFCVSNPNECPGWDTRQNQIYLTLNDINKPYNNLSNPLVFKKACENPTPTETPTDTPTPTDPTETPTPTDTPTPTPTDEPTPGGHAKCDPITGEECKCMPPSCTGRDCSTKKLACDKPDNDCPDGICRACEYNALAFVEECLKIDPVTGNCEQLPGSSRLNATPIAQAELDKTNPTWQRWAPMNNRQAANDKRAVTDKPSVKDKFELDNTKAVFGQIVEQFPLFDFGKNTAETGIAISPRQYSRQDITVQKLVDLIKENLPGVKIASTKELSDYYDKINEKKDIYIPNEQYNNMEEASVSLFYNEDLYRIVPNGRNLYSCTNDNAADIVDEMIKNGAPQAEIDRVQKMQTGVGACNTAAFNANENKRTADGLVVGCGQRIVYGWTLQKCTFDYDYIFVVDTSSTMVQPDKNLGGKRKIDAVVEQLNEFVDDIAENGTDSRIALVNFNNAHYIYKGLNRELRPEALAADGKHMGIQSNLVPAKDNTEKLKTVIQRLNKWSDNMTDEPKQGGLMERGTCIECGLDLANHIAEKRTQEEMRQRPAIVIFLTDGIPNSYPGQPTAQEIIKQYPAELLETKNGLLNVRNSTPFGWKGLYDSADRLRKDGIRTIDNGDSAYTRVFNPDENVFDTVKLITIGYGDTNLPEGEGQKFDRMINAVASERANNPGARWSFSTDPVKESQLNISEVFSTIQKEVNTCSMMELAFDISQRARDINGDGIVNTVDLFMLYDNYGTKGKASKYDINQDGIVGALDVSLILNSLGTVITEDTKADTPNEVDQVNSRNVQSN